MNRSFLPRAAASAALAILATAAAAAVSKGPEFRFLDDWDSSGVPENLEDTRESYSDEFLEAVAQSLPEWKKVPELHPEYIKDETARNLAFVEDAEVWISFVHEGAGYRNVAGVFIYDTDSPPKSVSGLERIVAFPNASFAGSGGGLKTGDTVYIGKVKKGESIGFCCVADGFTNKGKVGEGIATFWSIDELNPESDADARKHTVLLQDPDKGRFVIAFEDMLRDRGSDDDFNDLILSVQVNPPEAVETKDVVEVPGIRDTDADGVPDSQDDYPEDAERAFRVEFPAAGKTGTIAFEDMWPKKGDYDFNDLVASWHIVQARNAKSEVVDVETTVQVLASGASRALGLLQRLPVSRGNVDAATMAVDSGSAASVSADSLLDEAVFQFFGDVSDAIGRSSGAKFANTEPGTTAQTGRTYRLKVTFTDPVTVSSLGAAPYDLFIRDGNAEVHLPGKPATARMNTSLWGMSDDASEPSNGVTYVTKTGQPWAILAPGGWKHPSEHVPITRAYTGFASWAESEGATNTGWADSPVSGAVWTAK